MSGAEPAPPWGLQGGGGLCALVADGGGLASLASEASGGGIELVQHAASAFEPGLTGLWVRDRRDGRRHPALGPGSGARVRVVGGALVAEGRGLAADDAGSGLRWRVTLALHPARPAWAWHVEVVNDGAEPREIDVLHAHDVALSGLGALRANELYVSQYLDLTPLDGPTGTALAVRQNLPQGAQGAHPFCVLAADRRVVAWATDALDALGMLVGSGRDVRGEVVDLPARRRQHEHTLAALQVAPAVLGAGQSLRVTFAGLLVPDHPAPTSPADVAVVAEALELAAETAPWVASAGGTDLPPGGEPSLADGPPLGRPAPSGAYDRGRELRARDLTDVEVAERWPAPWRLVERADDGTLLSFFAGSEHVVTQAKERVVLRPHGTILRTGDRAEPDPEGLTVTAWMTGSPLAYLTRGNVTTGRVLTTVRGYLGLHRAYGLRVFVEVAGAWRLLDRPSAFAMTLDGARWVYAMDGGSGPDGADVGDAVEVRTHVPADVRRADLHVTVAGVPRRILLALHLVAPEDPLPVPAGTGPTAESVPGGVVVRVPGASGAQMLHVQASVPLTLAGDAPLFDPASDADADLALEPDVGARAGGVVTVRTEPTGGLALGLTVAAAPPAADGPGPEPAVTPEPAPEPEPANPGWWAQVTPFRVAGPPEVDALDASLPWLVRDALVHHLAPRGLEQYTGGAWGTRDVAQGPLELLLALDRPDDARRLLRTVFGAQNPDGSWPQAFGFLPGDEGFRMEPPHGDVVHWPVLALGRYLQAWGDAGLLDEPVGWFAPRQPDGAGAAWSATGPTSLLDHALRALDRARAGLLPGTHLVAYGHGDWNDSLQPADPDMARTMASAWTVTLHHQSLVALADGLGEVAEHGADHGELAAALRTEAAEVAADLHRYLLVDGELAGYVQLGGAEPRYLVHPRDTETGLRHGALQIIHALGDDLLDPAHAAHHVALVREHLMGVDGVRLFDRPPGYHGGETRHFQRAETATFVGREIGLMYVHAHLRWCEAMARWGDPDALWLGLQQVLPAAVGTGPEVVHGARRRQANTYSSSSDAAVLDRADFAARYAEVRTGDTGLEGGWRIYSSGPGVLVRVVTQSLLGVRRRGRAVEIDPVLPRRLDGLTATVPLAGGLLRLRYRVGDRGCGVVGLRVGGRALDGSRTANPYRTGGLAVPLDALADALGSSGADGPELEVELP